jgi:hypothetical protein
MLSRWRRATSLHSRLLSPVSTQRFKSSTAGAAENDAGGGLHPEVYPFDEDGNAGKEVINFPAVDRQQPSYNSDTKPVLLNSKEHAVGYLSRILNARVYEAAIETELQHAKNLSAVRVAIIPNECMSLLQINPSFNPFIFICTVAS